MIFCGIFLHFCSSSKYRETRNQGREKRVTCNKCHPHKRRNFLTFFTAHPGEIDDLESELERDKQTERWNRWREWKNWVNIMEQSQSVSSVRGSGWLTVSVSGLLRCSLIAVGTHESLWQLSVSLLQDEPLGLWSHCRTFVAEWFGVANSLTRFT